MDQKKISVIVAAINKVLVAEEATLEEVEAVTQSMVRHFLDNLTDIADIDYFQDRLNDMLDKYVDTHFEDVYEDSVG
ncbi:MAG: hypothetical protein HZB29_04245 [Nitrospinae bacterium]|nr:hypothetical protein [Nitrospinota bacterium]